MNLRDFIPSESNVPAAVLREHWNETRRICTGDGIGKGLQEDGAWLNHTIWGHMFLFWGIAINMFRQIE